jgi:WD40 repeat protein
MDPTTVSHQSGRTKLLLALFVLIALGAWATWQLLAKTEPRVVLPTTASDALLGFSPDARMLVTRRWVNDDGPIGRHAGVRLWDVTSGREYASLAADVPNIWVAQFSPDGKLLAVDDGEGNLRLWDVATRQEVATLKKDSKRDQFFGRKTPTFGFSGDSAVLAFPVEGGVQLWDVATRRDRVELTGAAWPVAYSRNGKVVATAGREGEGEKVAWSVKLWDPADGRERATFKGHSRQLMSLAFSSDGQTLASAESDPLADVSIPPPQSRSKIKLWEIATGKEKTSLDGRVASENRVSFQLGDRLLLNHVAPFRFDLWDVSEMPPREVGSFDGVHGRASLSPDAQFLALARFQEETRDGKHFKHVDAIRVLEVPALKERAVLKVAWTGDNLNLVFSPKGETFVAIGPKWDGKPLGESVDASQRTVEIKFLDIARGQEIVTIPQQATHGWLEVEVSPDGKTLATRPGNEARITIWDLPAGRP